MDKMQPVLFIDLLLPPVDDREHLPRLLLRERLQRIQSLPEPGQPHRHDRDTLQQRKVPRQVTDGALQLFPVIDPFAEDDLSVHLDPALVQDIHLLQRVSGEAVVEHPASQLGIRCLEGDVDRLQPVSDDPLYIMVAHICQGDIIPLEK